MANYRFKKGHENTRILLSREKVIVTQENISDYYAELILNDGRYAAFRHNIELIPGKESEVLQKKKAEGGVLELPESIVSALREAQIGAFNSENQPEKKESNSNGQKPLTAKRGPKPKSKGQN